MDYGAVWHTKYEHIWVVGFDHDFKRWWAFEETETKTFMICVSWFVYFIWYVSDPKGIFVTSVVEFNR